MRYTIQHPQIGGLDLQTGAGVDAFDAVLRSIEPTVEGWSYSFSTDALEVSAPPGCEQTLARFGEVVVSGDDLRGL